MLVKLAYLSTINRKFFRIKTHVMHDFCRARFSSCTIRARFRTAASFVVYEIVHDRTTRFLSWFRTLLWALSSGLYFLLSLLSHAWQISTQLLNTNRGPAYRVLKKIFFCPYVSGTSKPVEYAIRNRFSKYCCFLGLNRPWSLVITHSHLTWTINYGP